MLRVREMLLSPSGAAVAAGLPAVRSYARTARQLDELLHAAVLPSSALVDDGASILGALSAAFDDVIAREHAPDDLRARARADRAYWQAEQIAALDVPTEWAKVRNGGVRRARRACRCGCRAPRAMLTHAARARRLAARAGLAMDVSGAARGRHACGVDHTARAR